MLWISLIVGAAVMASIALSSLDRQRRLFFTNPSWGYWRGAPRWEGNSGDRLRHLLSSAQDSLARITAGGGGHALHRASVGKDVLQGWLRRRFHREHAAQVVLRAMSAAGATPSPEAGTSTSYAATTPVPEAELPIPRAEATPSPEAELPTPSAETAEVRADRAAALQPVIDTLIVTASAAGEGIVRVDANGQLRFPDPIARDLLQWSSGERSLSDILIGGSRQATALLEAVVRQEVVEQNVTVLNGGSSRLLHVTALASRSRDGSLWGALLILRRL